jgi:hypothetical protein
MKFICKTFSQMSVILRAGSNVHNSFNNLLQ